MANSEEDILGPAGIPIDSEHLQEYPFAAIKQKFNGVVTPKDSNVNKNNISVVYQIYDNTNILIDTVNTTTNSNGEHELQYTFPHKGNYTIITKVGDDTFSLPIAVGSLVDDITVHSSSSRAVAGSNVTLTAQVVSSTNRNVDNADVTFKITQDIDSFTEEKSISDYYELDYDIYLPKINLECKLKGQLGVSILPKNSSNESLLLQTNLDNYQTLKIVDDGTSLKYYLNNVLKGTLSTGIKKLYIWGQGGSVKELTFTSNDTVSASATGSSGETSISYNYPGGTCNVKAIASYGIDSNESSSITITESPALFDEITVTSDKDIISYNGGNNPESATLSAQLKKNGANANVSGQTVTFEVRKVSDDSLVETLTGSTNSSGLASVSYLGKGVGDLNIKAECMFVSKTFAICDANYTCLGDKNQVADWTVNSNTQLTYSNNGYHQLMPISGRTDAYPITIPSITLPSNFELDVDVLFNGGNSQPRFGAISSNSNTHYFHFNKIDKRYTIISSPKYNSVTNVTWWETSVWYHLKLKVETNTVTAIVYNTNNEKLVEISCERGHSDSVYPYVIFGYRHDNNTYVLFKNMIYKPL